MDLITVILFRGAERIIGILVGGMLAWLGFRLFLDVQTKADSSGKFVLPGGTAIHLTRVGPGVFFSLFGTGIVMMSFLHPVDFKKEGLLRPASTNAVATSELANSIVESTSFRSANSGTIAPANGPQERRSLARRDILALNRLPSQLDPRLGSSEKNGIEIAVRRIKLNIMEPLWGKDWGDFKTFTEWAGSGTPPPEGCKGAADYYNTGE